MGKFKITCEEATTICTKSQYGEASFIEKIKLNFHFIFCKYCRAFTKQNAQLSSMCEMAKHHQKDTGNLLTESDKEKLKQQIKELQN